MSAVRASTSFSGAAAIVLALLVVLQPAPAQSLSTLYGLVDTGEVFASSDGGTTWEIRSTIAASDAVALVAGEISSDLTLVSAAGSVYRSTDAGWSWSAVGSITSSDVVDVTVRLDRSLVALTATGSLYRSTDDGMSWQAMAALPASDFVSVVALQNDDLYALTRTGAVIRSSDRGFAWTSVAALTVSNAVDIRGLDAGLNVLTETGDIFQSTDGGSSWLPVSTLSQVHMCGLTITHDGLAAATQEGEVAVSADGITWTWVGTMNQVWVTALASDVTILTATPPAAGPGRVALGVPYPNPGSGNITTFFPVTVSQRAAVRLRLFDARGRLVAERAQQFLDSAGEHALPWHPGPLAAGAYFVQVTTADGIEDATRWAVIR